MDKPKENGTKGIFSQRKRKESTVDRRPRRKVLPLGERLRSWRWMTAMIAFLGFINSTLMRNSFNMALVCMTGSEPPPGKGDNSTLVLMSLNTTMNSTSRSVSSGEFDWDEQTQGIILSSVLYFGFMAPAISGVLSKKFGARRIVGICLTICSVMNLLTPLGARTHVYVLIAMRVIVGCFSGTIYPSSQALWADWAPDQEKVQLVSWTLSGVNIGSLVSSLISGFLCTIPFDNGWPFVFYVFGGMSLVWCIVWWLLVYDTPDKHKWVSEQEVQYIKDNIHFKSTTNTSIPYKSLFTSAPLWAFIVIQSIHMWCATVFFTYLPKYMRDVLRFPIELNAVMSSVPFASRFLGTLFWGMVADQMDRRHVSVTANRKIVQSTGFLTCAAITAAIGYMSEERRHVAVALFVITMFFQSCTFAASSIVPLDMAPRLASVITGMFLGVGGFAAIFAPITVSYMTPHGTLEEWRGVFFMLVGCYVVGVATFVIFGSAEPQPWGTTPPIDTIIHEPSSNNLADLDTSTCVNDDVIENGGMKRTHPRILIEREVSVISNVTLESSGSPVAGSPVVKVTSVYFLGEGEDEGQINVGFQPEPGSSELREGQDTDHGDCSSS